MNTLNPVLSVLGRVLIALIFILAGLNKIGTLEGTQGYMEAMGLPGILIYPTILFEIGAGLAITVGFRTRVVALALAGFSVASAVIFHRDFGDQTQFIMFMKNLAIAGGFLILARHGAGELSLDKR